MINENNIFTLRFFGNDVSPNSFSAKELGELIIAFHEGLKSLIENNYPSIEPTDVKISLVGIENKSQSLAFAVSDQKEAIAAIREYSEHVDRKEYTDLPQKTYKSVKNIYQIAKSKKCNAELVQHGDRLFVVSYEDILIEQNDVLIKSNLTLYGELNKIGGNEPRAWVNLFDGSKIAFKISDTQLIKLRGKVKETIGIKGEAKWNAKSNKVISFKLKEIIDYSGDAYSGFTEFKNITSGFWDTLNTDSEIFKHLKGDS